MRYPKPTPPPRLPPVAANIRDPLDYAEVSFISETGRRGTVRGWGLQVRGGALPSIWAEELTDDADTVPPGVLCPLAAR